MFVFFQCTEQGTLQPVILKPKLENQPNLGARIASKEELANDWTTLFFIPFSNLYRSKCVSLKKRVCPITFV